MPDPSLSESRLLEPSNNAYETAVTIDEQISNDERELLGEDENDGFVKRKLGVLFWIAAGWFILVAALAILAPWLTEKGILQDPYKLTRKLLPPSPDHWLGTDDLGRDTFSRLIWGARVSLSVGFASIALGLLFGVTIGIVAGYLKGWIDSSLMTAMDIILAFPALLLALSIIGFSGQKTIPFISIAIGVIAIPSIARLVRANTLSFREREFVLASRTLGASHGRIIAREILPNVVPPVVSFAVIGIAVAIAAEAGLAFLGVSVELPTATWGGMINAARPQLQNYPLQVFIPCAVLTITVMAFYVMGDRLRAYFDVKEGGL
jgi:peptide/nickel transport system permease protein